MLLEREKTIDNKIIDNIRSLSIDMITNAKSGHPGICLGAAPILYALYKDHINIDANYPNYFNRDRFIMSAGHGSALLYSTLFFAGFPITLDDLKSFRQLDSITPGHPEYGKTPGVDMTTGPLGEGISTAVGIAMAERYLNAYFNDKKKDLINYYTYVLASDGDLMEGSSYEACTLAGNFNLNKLIVLYDMNGICLDGEVSKSTNENLTLRFSSINWNVITVENGDNYEEISKAIEEAKTETTKPTIIAIKTIIGKNSNKEGTSDVHGSPLTEEEVTELKDKLDIRDVPFTVFQNLLDEFRKNINDRCFKLNDKFINNIEGLDDESKEVLDYLMNEDKSIDLKNLAYQLPDKMEEKARITSGKVLSSIVTKYPYVLGGSADLFKPTCTYIDGVGDFTKDNYSGKNIYYGVREHAMAAISNGLALCGLRPYAATFLSFSNFMLPSIRLACMMHLPITYIFTHDSISVGEDGPTHQPIEQISQLRDIPNLEVFRPADVNEIIGAYKEIYNKKDSPSAILLSRNTLPILNCTKTNEVVKGGYIARDFQTDKKAIIISSGEELSKCIDIATKLQSKGIGIRVVSVPNIDRFLSQDKEYIDEVLPVEIKKIVIEASNSKDWYKIIYNLNNVININDFGVSAPKEDVYKHFEFDIDSLQAKIEEIIK